MGLKEKSLGLTLREEKLENNKILKIELKRNKMVAVEKEYFYFKEGKDKDFQDCNILLQSKP